MSITVLKSDYFEPEAVKEKTLPEYYLARAKQYADEGREYWLVDGLTGEKRFFHKFEEETRRIASAFYKCGLRKGDVVIYMIQDLSKAYITLTGIWRANGIVRASYPDDDKGTVYSRVKESSAKIIICEERTSELCKNVAELVDWKMQVVTPNRNSCGLPSIQGYIEEDDGLDCPNLEITANDVAIVLCTSGTTGLPKAAVYTHMGFLYQTQMLELEPWTYPKPNLFTLKATHIGGACVGLVLLGCGKTAVVLSNPTQETVFNAAANYKPGLVLAYPTFLLGMAGPEADGYDFSSIEIIFAGGIAVTKAVRNTLLSIGNVKDILVSYGLTETMMCATNCVLKKDNEREMPSIRDWPYLSVGKPFPGTQLEIRDPETLKILGPNEQGEICVKSPGMFQSYLNNPEATRKAFTNDGSFKTGDLGYFDGDTGFVFVVDRLKEIFKYYHNHISPTELENVIAGHPAVREVCVVGISDVGGHVPRAFVTINPINSEDIKQISEEILKFANENLADYKKLRGGLYVVKQLTKGKSGKITRRLLENFTVPY